MKALFGLLLIFISPISYANYSFVGVHSQYFIGDVDKSLDEGSGFGLTYLATPHEKHFRVVMGGQLTFSGSAAKINGNEVSSTLYSADFMPGVSFYPFLDTKLRPHLSAFGLLGIKYLNVSNGVAGVEGADKLGLSFGYQMSLGVDFEINRRSVMGFYVNYISNKASKLADQSGFDFGGMGILLGLQF